MEHQFATVLPEQVAEWLEAVSAPWWIAGGWAIDLGIGEQTRNHSDIEIGSFRQDLPDFLKALPQFDFYIAREGQLIQMASPSDLSDSDHGLWLKEPDARLWSLEILLEIGTCKNWIYRRDDRITAPLNEICTRTTSGMPIMRTEVQLLYKAKAIRDKDEADFKSALPHLSSSALDWLMRSLILTIPGHAWIAKIDERLKNP